MTPEKTASKYCSSCYPAESNKLHRKILYGPLALPYQHSQLWLVFIDYSFTHLLTVTQSYCTVTSGIGVSVAWCLTANAPLWKWQRPLTHKVLLCVWQACKLGSTRISTAPLLIIDHEAGEIIRLIASVCLSVLSQLNNLTYTMHVQRSGRYVGSACRVLRKITMIHGIQSNISVCLSVIRKCSRLRTAHSGWGLLI